MFAVREAATPEEREICFRIRRTVFVEGQGVPIDLEYDAHDATAYHCLVFRKAEGEGEELPVAASRLVRIDETSVKIGRMAVLEAARGSGAGRAMLDHLLERARARGATRAVLNAQAQVIGFYEKAGFRSVGPGHVEAGIPHQYMERAI